MSPPQRRPPTAYAAARASPTTPLLSNHSLCSGWLMRCLGFGVKQFRCYPFLNSFSHGDDCRIPVLECVYKWIQVLERLGVILVPERNNLRGAGDQWSRFTLYNKLTLLQKKLIYNWLTPMASSQNM
ncbi:hypothetical protein VPH35_093305 [Triticum aestivum]